MTRNRLQVIIGELGLVIIAGYHGGALACVAAICGLTVLNGVVGAVIDELTELYKSNRDYYEDHD